MPSSCVELMLPAKRSTIPFGMDAVNEKCQKLLVRQHVWVRINPVLPSVHDLAAVLRQATRGVAACSWPCRQDDAASVSGMQHTIEVSDIGE